MKKPKKNPATKEKFSWELMYKQRFLLMMSVPFLIWLIIFKYIPLWGWTMAFQEVTPKTFAMSVWERPFVGFGNFVTAFTDRLFAQTMMNTIFISILGIGLGTAGAILFALMLNEIRMQKFKKFTQTVSYLPHFVSWVIIASIAKMFLNDGGALETMLGGARLHLMSSNSPMFWIVVCLINVWKEVGWDAIIYLSAMAGIDQGIYEAAKVDGANRWQRMWHITLPAIRGTIVIMLILKVGSLLNTGYEQIFLMQNSMNRGVSEVFDTYIYTKGVVNGNYSLATAAGMFKSVVSMIMVLGANKLAKMCGESGFY